jgi:hypothetical protein
MLEKFFQIDWALFFHIVGIIIGLGAVTVIDCLGFISRKDKKLTQVTIQAHHVTKPLIWLGTIIIFLSWIFIIFNEGFTEINLVKSVILLVLIFNGVFLSFYISPRLDKLLGKNIILPRYLQNKILVSMIISFIGWWTFVFLTMVNIG